MPLPAEQRNYLHRVCATWVAKLNMPFSMPEKSIRFWTYIAAISGGRSSPLVTATVIKDIHALAIESLTDVKASLPCMSPPRVCYWNYFSF
jgi:hypothetical protein